MKTSIIVKNGVVMWNPEFTVEDWLKIYPHLAGLKEPNK